MPGIEKLHQGLVDKGLYSKGLFEFQVQFSSPEKIRKLYDGLVDKQLYSKSFEEFNNQFFTDQVKKKEEALPSMPSEESGSLGTTPMPQDQPLVSFGEVMPSETEQSPIFQQYQAQKAQQPQGLEYGLPEQKPATPFVQETKKGLFGEELPQPTQVATTELPPVEEGVEYSAYNSLAAGLNSMYAAIARSPEFLYDLAAIPQNRLAEIFDKPEWATSAAGAMDRAGISNKLAEYFEERRDYLRENNKQFEDGIVGAFEKGNYTEGFQALSNSLLESAPPMLLSFFSGTGGPATARLGLAILGGTTAVNKSVDLRDQEGMSQNAKTFNAIGNGMMEIVFEGLGTQTAGRVFSEIIKKEGKESAKDIIQKGLIDTYEQLMKKYPLAFGTISEGSTEWMTQVTQNIVDKYTGEDPGRNIFEGGADAFVAGYAMGAGIGAPSAIAKKVMSSKSKSIVDKNEEDIINIKETLSDPQGMSQEKISALENLRDEKIAQNKEIISKTNEAFDRLDDSQKSEFLSLKDSIKTIESELETTENEIAKQALQLDLKEKTQQLNNLINNAVQKQATSEVPVQPEARVGEEVAQGAPEAKPEVVTEEGVPEEIASLKDDQDVVINVKTIEEVPDQFKDRAIESAKTTIESRKSFFGIPYGKVEKTEVGGGYSYTITGKEAKEYAASQAVAPEIVEEVKPIAEIETTTPEGYSLSLAIGEEGFVNPEEDIDVYDIAKEENIPLDEDYKLEYVAKDKDGKVIGGVVSSMTAGKTTYAPVVSKEAVGTEAESAINNAVSSLESKGAQQVEEAVSETIKKTTESLKVTFPEVDVITGENEADTKAKIVEKLTPLIGKRKANAAAKKFTGAAGQAIFAGGRPVAIVIDKAEANTRTAGHEAWEVMLNDAFGNDPAAFEDFRNSIDRQLRLNGFEDIANELQRFSEQYSEEGNEAVFREYMAEFGGMLVEGGFDPANLTSKQKSFLEKVKEILNKFTKELIGTEIFLKDATPENIIDFMATISKKVAKGEGVAEFFVREEGFGDEPSQITAFSQLSNKQKKKYEESLKKRRPDLVESGLVDSVVSEIEKFGEENSVDGTGNRRLEDLAAHYIYNGNVILPEDGYKVLEANRLAKANKVDPFSFKDPLLLIEKYEKFTKKGNVDPDDVPEFKDKKTIDEYGLSIYTVDDTKEGQAAVRAAIDADFGENANPWCLAARQNGTLNTAWSYWNRYNEYPKKIAFRNGKLVAFSANDAPYEVWWDKQDNPSKGIEVKKKIDSNTTQDIYVNLEGKIVEEGDVIKKEKTKNNNGDSVEKITRIRPDRSGDEKNFVNGKRDGESIYYYNIDDKSIRRISNFKDNALDGEEKIFRRDNTLESLQTYKDGKLNGPHLKLYPDGSIGVSGQYKDNFQVGTWNVYQMNGLKQSIRNYDEKGRLNGESKQWDDNGNLISISNYKNGQRAGKQESWHENGQKRTEKYFLSTGSWTNKTWYENGQLESEKSYKDGELNGQYIIWDEYGVPTKDENYKNGVLHGIKRVYDPLNGKVIRSTEYRNGYRDGKQDIYNREGTLLSSETFADDNLNGPAEYFYEDGEKNSEVNFVDYKLDGNVRVFNEVGIVQFDGKYSDDLLDGVQKYFNDNGELEREQVYDKGSLVKETIYEVPVNSLREDLSGRDGVSDRFIDALYRAYSADDARKVNERWINNREISDVVVKIRIFNFEQRSQKKRKESALSDRQNREIGGVVKRALERGNTRQEAIDAAQAYLENSPTFLEADDITREQMLRDFKDRFYQKVKKAPSAASVLDPKFLQKKLSVFFPEREGQAISKKKKKVVVDEAAALKSQIKLEAKAAKDAVAFLNGVRKSIADAIKTFEKSNKIPGVKARSIINRMSRMNLENPVVVDRFIDYVAKVFSDALYVEKIAESNKLQKAIRSRSKSKDIQAQQAAIGKNFAKINPRYIEDIDLYLEKARAMYDAIKRTDIKMDEGVVNVMFKTPIEFDNMQDYIDEQLKKQDEIRRDILLSMNKELTEDGVISSDMTFEEVKLVLDAINNFKEDTSEAKSERIRNKELLSAYVNNAFNRYAAVLKNAIENDADPFTGDKIYLTESQRKTGIAFANMNPELLSIADKIRAIEAIENFMVNQTTDGMGATVQAYQKVEQVNADAKKPGFKAKPLTQVERAGLEWFVQLQEKLTRMMKSKNVSDVILLNSGFTMAEKGKASAHEYSRKIIDKYSDKFKKVKDFHSAENTYERGIFSILYRTIQGSSIKQQEYFNKMKKLIDESIEARTKTGDKKQTESAKIQRQVFDRIAKDANNISDVIKNIKAFNKQAVDFWVNEWALKFDEFQETSRSIRNTILEQDLNFNAIRYSSLDSKSELDDETAFIKEGSYYYDKEAGSFMPRRDFTSLPRGENGKVERALDLEFDTVAYNAFTQAMVDNSIAPHVIGMKAYFNSPAFTNIIEKDADRKLFLRTVSEWVSQSKKGAYVPFTEIGALIKIANSLSSIASVRALSSVKQTLLQSFPPIVNTMVNTDGNFNAFEWMNRGGREFVERSNMPIVLRGMESRADVSKVKALMQIKDDNAIKKIVKEIRSWGDWYLSTFLGKTDKVVASISYFTYYNHYLKKNGVDVSKIDWYTHEPNPLAEQYAQSMVNRNQNVSDIDTAGKLLKSKEDMIVLVRKSLFPFASFAMNQKGKMINDIMILTSKSSTLEESSDAYKSLVALSAEMVVFRAVKIAFLAMEYWAAMTLASLITGEDEDKKFREFINDQVKKQTGLMLPDILSPVPVTDRLSMEAFNKILKEAGVSEEDLFYVPYEETGVLSRALDVLGTFGMQADKMLQVAEYYDMAKSGEVEKSYRGSKYKGYITEDEKKVVSTAAALYAVYATGLLPEASIGSVATRMVSEIRKDAVTLPKTREEAMEARKITTQEERMEAREKELKKREKQRQIMRERGR